MTLPVAPLEWRSFLLLDLIEVGVLVIDGESILFANTAFSRIVGKNLRQLQARTLRELGGEAWIDFTLGKSWADALPWPMPDGTDRWFEVSLQPSDFEDRTINIATCIDVTSRMRAEGAEASMLQMLTEIIESYPIGTFVLDREHRITHFNRACEIVTGLSANDLIGSDEAGIAFGIEKGQLLADQVMEQIDETALLALYKGHFWPSPNTDGGYEAEIHFPGDDVHPDRWLHAAATPLRSAAGEIVGAIETILDITARKQVEEALRSANITAEQLVEERTRELLVAKAALEDDVARRRVIEAEMQKRLAEITELNTRLHEAQGQIMQNEKLASIGQLAAGVAHEINNPIGYVFSNVSTLQTYLDDLMKLLDRYVAAEPGVGDEATRQQLRELREKIDLDYLKDDLQALMKESREGIDRVRKIVQDLKDFSHVDTSTDWQWTDLHRGLESTLNVVNNEIKYKADVVREYGDLPQIQCLPSQLNQVFMNILVNAAHAIKPDTRGTISVRTEADDEHVRIDISDNGSGIPPEIMKRIFDPFFTTKPVGKGTGLGLSLSYGIVHKHHGSIEVDSRPGEGTRFRITLPISQPEAPAENDNTGSHP